MVFMLSHLYTTAMQGAAAAEDFAHHEHSYLAELLKYADQKAVLLITGAGFVSGWLLMNPTRLHVGPSIWSFGVGTLSLLCSLLAGVCGFCVIHPRQKYEKEGLVAFAAIAKDYDDFKDVWFPRWRNRVWMLAREWGLTRVWGLRSLLSLPSNPRCSNGSEEYAKKIMAETSATLTTQVLRHSCRLARIANQKYRWLMATFVFVVVAVVLAGGVVVFQEALLAEHIDTTFATARVPAELQLGKVKPPLVKFQQLKEGPVTLNYDVFVPAPSSPPERAYRVHLRFELQLANNQLVDPDHPTIVSSQTYIWNPSEEDFQKVDFVGATIRDEVARATKRVRVTLVFEHNPAATATTIPQ
jgi:hypothetical protein